MDETDNMSINPNGTANVTKTNATVVITWAWGQQTVIDDFDPTTDTIFIDWFGPGEVQVSETNGDVAFAIPGNDQTVTLAGVSLADLSPDNFAIMDSGLGAQILGLVASAEDTGDDTTDDDSSGDDTTGDGSNDDVPDTGDGANGGDNGAGSNGSNGDFEDFLDALLAFESGWDRERYDAGIISDEQLTTWARGTVQEFFPDSGYTSWGDLTDAEWETMAYRSFNVFGFVGYQFGEALAIDLGYYDDDVYYLNGADTNTWDGTWTGKNGVNSLEDFITKEAQDLAIRDAFGHNLEIIEQALAAEGTSLDAYLGTTRIFNDNGNQTPVELTLTGILAAAHLSGAPAVVELLLNGTLANDEFGTSIMQYAYQFGGYDSPPSDELIASWIANLTGDEGLGSNRGSANVDADTADVVISWAYGQDDVITDFDPETDTIWVDWLTAADIGVYEENGSAVFAVPSNGDQKTTLQGVPLAELSLANFTILDESAAEEILALIGSDAGDDTGDNTTGDDGGDGSSDDGSTGDGSDGGDTSDGGDVGDDGGDAVVTNPNGTAGVTAAEATVVITWAWGQDTVIDDFDSTSDTIFVDWFHSGEVEVSEANGDVTFAIPGNNQTVTLAGISLADLSPANFTILDGQLGTEILGVVSAGNTVGNGDSSQDTDDPGGDGETGGAQPDGEVDVFHFDWNWGAQEVISDFAPVEDILDFGALPAALISISEIDNDLIFEVLNNGGHAYVLEGVQAEDLSAANFTAADWNTVLESPNGVFDQLAMLGNQDILLT